MKKQTGRDTVPGFADLMLRYRERCGLNRAQLAKAAGVSPQTIGDIEADRRSPSLRVAAAIARALEIPVMLWAPTDPIEAPAK